MPESLYMRRRGNTLTPCSLSDEEDLMEFPEGKDLSVQIHRPRSNKQHRFFMGLLRLVCMNTDLYSKPEQLLLWLKVRLGYVDEIKFHDGRVLWSAKSISFNSMKQDEFRKFFDESLDVIVSEVIPNMEAKSLIREVEKMLRMKLSSILKENEDGI